MPTVFVPPLPRLAVDHHPLPGGDGALVVLLHGVGGNRRNWQPTIPALAQHYAVAAWDARGYGDSEDVPGPRVMADFRDDLARLLDHFGAERAHLVGLSMGGRIALSFHAAHPERVISLALCDTHMGFAHFTPEQGEKFIAQRRDPLLAGKTPAEIAPALARKLIGDPDDTPVLEALIDSLSRLTPESYIKTLEATVHDDRATLLDGIAVPTLILTGALDRLTPPKLAARMHDVIPGSELAIIEGAGHLSNIERPEAFNRLLLDFLSRASGRG